MKLGRMATAVILAGFLMPATAYAEEDPTLEKEEQIIVTVEVTDSSGVSLAGSEISLFDSDDPENNLEQWTVDDEGFIEISSLAAGHSYFIR